MTIDRGHKGSIVAIILLILTFLILAQAVASGETGKPIKTKGWPMLGHDPQHTGRSPVTGISKKPVIKWASSGDHFVVDGNGKIYVEFSKSRYYKKRRLVVLSDDGKILWTYHSKKEFTSPPALGANGNILVGAGKYLVAVSKKGVKQWESKVLTGDYNEINSPLVVSKEGTVYLTTEENKLVALDSTGKKKWTFERLAQEDTFPAVGPGGTIYITSDKDNLLAIGQKGSLKWKFATEESTTSPSVGVQDGNAIIYFGAGSDLYTVSSKGTEKWVYKTGDKLRSPPAIGPDGTVFFGSLDAHYYAVNPDGTTEWIINTEGEAVGGISPVVDSKGVAYLSIPSEIGGYISAISPDGAVKWKVLIPESHVSLAIGPKGSIYGVSGNFYALGSYSPSTREK